MDFLFGLYIVVGTHFSVIVGFTMGVRSLFMGENLAIVSVSGGGH